MSRETLYSKAVRKAGSVSADTAQAGSYSAKLYVWAAWSVDCPSALRPQQLSWTQRTTKVKTSALCRAGLAGARMKPLKCAILLDHVPFVHLAALRACCFSLLKPSGPAGWQGTFLSSAIRASLCTADIQSSTVQPPWQRFYFKARNRHAFPFTILVCFTDHITTHLGVPAFTPFSAPCPIMHENSKGFCSCHLTLCLQWFISPIVWEPHPAFEERCKTVVCKGLNLRFILFFVCFVFCFLGPHSGIWKFPG